MSASSPLDMVVSYVVTASGSSEGRQEIDALLKDEYRVVDFTAVPCGTEAGNGFVCVTVMLTKEGHTHRYTGEKGFRVGNG